MKRNMMFRGGLQPEDTKWIIGAIAIAIAVFTVGYFVLKSMPFPFPDGPTPPEQLYKLCPDDILLWQQPGMAGPYAIVLSEVEVSPHWGLAKDRSGGVEVGVEKGVLHLEFHPREGSPQEVTWSSPTQLWAYRSQLKTSCP